MSKKAVSLTLDEANVLWLKGRTYGGGNLSAAVDDLIAAARAGRPGLAARCSQRRRHHRHGGR
jgi:hypothetical protein